MNNKEHDYSLLFLALITGLIAGVISTAFDQIIITIIEMRKASVSSTEDWHSILLWIAISAVLSGVAFYMVAKFAPEAAGSGIPQIEGALTEKLPVRYFRVILVKFFGGICTLASGLVLGREGPSVQMGAHLGYMFADLKKFNSHSKHVLLASGAAAGLAAAFSAPLAGIMFVIEEMRSHFRYSTISVLCVFIAAISSTWINQLWLGDTPMLVLPNFSSPEISALPIFLIFGALMGLLGVCFNRWVLLSLKHIQAIHQQKIGRLTLIGMILGGSFAALSFYYPDFSGDGNELITSSILNPEVWSAIFLLLILRIILTLLCFNSGAPGGVFAPMLTIGALTGALIYSMVTVFSSWLNLPHLLEIGGITVGSFVLVGMISLFAASIRAPVTGILLIIELTGDYIFILPLMISSFTAVAVAYLLGGEPLYSQLLKYSTAKG